MPDFQHLLLFIAAGWLLNLTPGPDVLYIVTNSLRSGARAGIVAGLEQHFQAVHERVFVSPMERIARLKGDHAVPTFAGQQLAHFARREYIFAELRMLRLRQRTNLSAKKVRLVRGLTLEDHVGARMVDALGEIDALDVSRLVPLEDVGNLERANDLAG